MGQNDITITNAYNYKDYVCVEGSNFNDYSVVYINDKAYPTEIINSHLLRVEKAQVTAGNIVSVVQQGDDKIELSRVYLQVGESETNSEISLTTIAANAKIKKVFGTIYFFWRYLK